MNPTRHLRSRYIMALSALISVIIAIHLLLQGTIISQENNGRVINIASSQVGLVNRIALFSGLMATSATEDEYMTARQQVGRAIHRMRSQFHILLNGDPETGTPRIMTNQLKALYFSPNIGLKTAQDNFLAQAEIVYQTPFGELERNSSAYLYVADFGPFVLDNLLKAAVTEYENYSRSKIRGLRALEWLAIAAALILVIVEIFFIFIPLEKSINRFFQAMKKNQRHLEEAKIRAETANRAKTNFLLNMSHELRTPLNAIIGFSEGLEHGVYGRLKTKKQADCIADIRKSGAHLLALVDDILDLSAAETGKVKLNETMFALEDLASHSVSLVSGALTEKHHMLDFRFAPPDLKIKADERRIHQVLVNVLTNAIKFTPDGGKITLETFTMNDGGAGIVVCDTGIGMTPRETRKSRDRFGQIEDAMVRNHNGVGLGLPLAIELMEAHGGKLLIASVKGTGTRVTLLFPAARVFCESDETVRSAA